MDEWAQIRSRLNHARIARLESEIRNDVVAFKRRDISDAERACREQMSDEAHARAHAWLAQKLGGAVRAQHGMSHYTAERRAFAQRLTDIDKMLAAMA